MLSPLFGVCGGAPIMPGSPGAVGRGASQHPGGRVPRRGAEEGVRGRVGSLGAGCSRVMPALPRFHSAEGLLILTPSQGVAG